MEEVTAGRTVVKGYGQQHDAFVVFVPAASPAAQVMTHNIGVKSVTRTGAGVYVVLLQDISDIKALFAAVTVVDNGTEIQEAVVESHDIAAGTVTVRHRAATNDAATVLAASDTCDQIMVHVKVVRGGR